MAIQIFLSACHKEQTPEPVSPLAGTRTLTLRYAATKWDFIAPAVYDDDFLGFYAWTSPNLDDVIPYYGQSVIRQVIVKDSSGMITEVPPNAFSGNPSVAISYTASMETPRILF